MGQVKLRFLLFRFFFLAKVLTLVQEKTAEKTAVETVVASYLVAHLEMHRMEGMESLPCLPEARMQILDGESITLSLI